MRGLKRQNGTCICKKCGQTVVSKQYYNHNGDLCWTPPKNLGGSKHECKSMIKVFTKEEIELYKRGLI